MHTLVRAGVRVRRRRISALADMQRLIDEHGSLTLADAYRAYGHLRDASEIDPLVARRLSRHDPAQDVVRDAIPALPGRIASEMDGAVLLAATTGRDDALLATATEPARFLLPGTTRRKVAR